MAKIPEGVIGALIGRVGPVSGYLRNGENILRSAHSRSDRKVTPARTAQRAKIKICNDFTRAFSGTGFFNRTFPSAAGCGTGYNRATSAIMNLAITGNFPDTRIDYLNILISKGALPPPEKAAASINGDENIFFNWEDNTGNGTAKSDDKVIMVAYFPGLNQAVFSIGNGCRGDGHSSLNIYGMKGYAAETWLGFLSSDEKNASCSSYSGKTG
jgi:hypothetical protein